jgi:hypothetical protein
MSTTPKKTITVHAPTNMTLQQAQNVLATVLGKGGCPHCYSGLNINFVNVGDPAPLTLTIDQHSMQVTEVGG